jgi:hypothetical protein
MVQLNSQDKIPNGGSSAVNFGSKPERASPTGKNKTKQRPAFGNSRRDGNTRWQQKASMRDFGITDVHTKQK